MTGDSEARPSGASGDDEPHPADAACELRAGASTDDGEAGDDRYADVDTSHLDDVDDGCGCAEVWEHTSARRTSEGDAEAD